MTPNRPYDPTDPNPQAELRSGRPVDPPMPASPRPGDLDAPLSTNALLDDDDGAVTAPVVSGRVSTWDEAERIRLALAAQGFAPPDVEVFYTGPAGRHAVTPIGGDTHADAGSTRIATGATTGGVAGAAVGLAVGAAVATAPVTGPVLLTAAALGAFGGALAGGVTSSEDGSKKADSAEHPVAKPGGVVVAVRTDGLVDGEASALRCLDAGGAVAIERATARWRDGRWVDWSPTAPREQLAPQPGTPQA